MVSKGFLFFVLFHSNCVCALQLIFLVCILGSFMKFQGGAWGCFKGHALCQTGFEEFLHYITNQCKRLTFITGPVFQK